jgi:hypothetical protein
VKFPIGGKVRDSESIPNSFKAGIFRRESLKLRHRQ